MQLSDVQPCTHAISQHRHAKEVLYNDENKSNDGKNNEYHPIRSEYVRSSNDDSDMLSLSLLQHSVYLNLTATISLLLRHRSCACRVPSSR